MEQLSIDFWNRALRRRNTEEFNYYETDASYPLGSYAYLIIKERDNNSCNRER